MTNLWAATAEGQRGKDHYCLIRRSVGARLVPFCPLTREELPDVGVVPGQPHRQPFEDGVEAESQDGDEVPDGGGRTEGRVWMLLLVLEGGLFVACGEGRGRGRGGFGGDGRGVESAVAGRIL